jgi:TP901 family phage tail tape measure protein
MAGKKSSVISVLITGDSKQLSGAVDEANSRLSRLGSAVGVAAKAVAAGAAAIGAIAVREFAKFDSAMQQSIAIMGDVSDTMRKEMSDAARQVAKTTTFSAEQAAQSFYFLASAGLDAQTSIQALPKVAAFAQAGMFDMARATDILTDAQSALGLTSDDAAENIVQLSRVSNVLVKAATLANTSVEQLGEALTEKAGAAMKAAGMEFEAGAAALAVFADSGVKGSAAGTKLTAVIASLATNSRNNAEDFRRLGISVFDAEGNMRSMEGIVGDMERAFDGMTIEARNAELASLGLNRQALDGINLLMGNSEAMNRYASEMRDAGGITDEVANKQMQTFNAQLGLLKSLFADAAIEIGSALVPALMKIVEWIQKRGPEFTAWVESAGKKIAEFIDAAGVKAAEFRTFFDERLRGPVDELRGAIERFVNRAKRKFEEFRSAVPTAMQGFTDFISEVRALADNPEALGNMLGEALSNALFAAFEQIKRLSAQFNEAIRELIDRVDWFTLGRNAVSALLVFGLGFAAALLSFEWLMPVLEAIRNNLGVLLLAAISVALAPAAVVGRLAAILARIPLLGRLLAWALTALNRLGAAMRDRIGFVFRSFGEAFSGAISRLGPGIISRFVTWLRGIPRAISSAFDDVAINVASGFSRFGTAMGNGVARAVTVVRNLLSTLTRPFRDFGRMMVDDMVNVGRAIIDGMIRGIRSLGGALRDALVGAARTAWNAVKSFLGIRSPSTVFFDVGQDMMRGLINGIGERSGLLRDTMATQADIARREAEAASSAARTSARSGQTININVQGGISPAEEIAREIEKALGDSERRTGSSFIEYAPGLFARV